MEFARTTWLFATALICLDGKAYVSFYLLEYVDSRPMVWSKWFREAKCCTKSTHEKE